MLMIMWLATEYGFFSVVQKEPDLYFVRACVRQDLVNLVELLGLETEIHEWAEADYRYRIMIELDDLFELMVQLAAYLDYPNFKERVYEREDQSNKLGAYHQVWSLMLGLQNKVHGTSG